MPVEDPVVRAAQRGDLRSFEVLVRRHSPQLYRVARRAGLSEHAAEDALQLVWLTVWRSLPEYQGRAELSTWLFTVTRRTSLKLLLRQTDRPTDDVAERLPHEESAEDRVLSDQSDQAVRSAVADLPADLADPVALHHLQGLSVPEIAALLDLPVATVRGRIYRGRQQLATALQEWR